MYAAGTMAVLLFLAATFLFIVSSQEQTFVDGIHSYTKSGLLHRNLGIAALLWGIVCAAVAVISGGLYSDRQRDRR